MACRILVLQPGIEPWALAVTVPNPNQWTIREFPQYRFFECTGFTNILPDRRKKGAHNWCMGTLR